MTEAGSAEEPPAAGSGGVTAPPRQKGLGRRALLVLGLGVLLYLGLVLLRDVGRVRAALGTFAWWTFAAALALAFGNYSLRFLKWEYYLSVLRIRDDAGERVPTLDSFLTFLSGFVLTVTPGKVGEVFKSFVLSRTHGIAVERTASIVVAERVTDLIGIISLIALGSLSLPGGGFWAAVGGVVVLSVVLLVASERLSSGVLGLLTRAPGALGRVLSRAAPRIEHALSALRVLTSPKHLLLPSALSVVAWGLEGLALLVILRGFEQATSVLATVFFYSTATLAGALVPVPGGLGVTEKIMEEGLHRVGGVPAEVATIAMLLVRFATLWFAVGVGFVALGWLRRRHPKLSA